MSCYFDALCKKKKKSFTELKDVINEGKRSFGLRSDMRESEGGSLLDPPPAQLMNGAIKRISPSAVERFPKVGLAPTADDTGACTRVQMPLARFR